MKKYKIYIASSWKNQHAVEMLTSELRRSNFEVLSFVENNYGEGHGPDKPINFEEWMKTKQADYSFEYDTNGAMTCDVFIYISPAGKDASAECGMCYGQRLDGKTIPMLGLYAKGEDFGLMRKMFDHWFDNYLDLIMWIEKWREKNKYLTK
jgi:hypothetical protein